MQGSQIAGNFHTNAEQSVGLIYDLFFFYHCNHMPDILIPDANTVIRTDSALPLSARPSASHPPHTSVQHGTYLKLQPVSSSFLLLLPPMA